MATSLYMSDVKVEIAFNSGFSTPASSRVWTDVSQWVELAGGISIGYGRQDERSQADANTLALTLDNADGRFTPGRPSSPYFPTVKLYRPIRVTATPPGGSASVRFTGFVDQWPLEWDGSDAYAKSQLTAVSRLSRLGMLDERRSVIEETLLLSSPVLYYTMGEQPEAAQASDSAGAGQPMVATGTGLPVIFGEATGPPTDALTAVRFDGGQYLRAAVSVPLAANSIVTLSAFVLVSGPSTRMLTLATAAGAKLVIGVSSPNLTAQLSAGVTTSPLLTAAVPALFDGGTHHLVVTVDESAGRLRVWVDGSLVGDEATIGIASDASSLIQLEVGRNGFLGVFAHLAVLTSALSSGAIADIIEAGVGGYEGESSMDRFARYADWAGVEAGSVTFISSNRSNVAVETSGQSVVDLMRQIEVTEAAVLFDARDGSLCLFGESQRYIATAAFTLDMATQQVEGDFAPQYDPSTILNDVTASRVGGSPSARVVDQQSKDDYGAVSSTIETTSDDDGAPLQLASWAVGRYAEPRVRIPNVTVDVAAQTGKTPSPSTLLSANVGTLMQVVNQPSQAAAATAHYFIEGYTETFNIESHVISFNVSLGAPYTNVFILNDATRGLLNGTNVLGL